jgi:hypothetical protein
MYDSTAEGNQKIHIFLSLFHTAVLGKKERERETRQGGLTDMQANYAIKRDPITLEEPQYII